MAFNPAKGLSQTATPTQRMNEVNDPDFQNAQGYFPYDLTHQEFITPRFGEVTPSMFLHTVGGDRIAHHDNMKTILNQINGNFLSTINQYVDSYYVPLRSLFPYNYEKLIPNPTKGDDLPNAALPQFALSLFFKEYLASTLSYTIQEQGVQPVTATLVNIMDGTTTTNNRFRLARFMTFLYMVSRGQLLDYLGVCFDDNTISTKSKFQDVVDEAFNEIYNLFLGPDTTGIGIIYECDVNLVSNQISMIPNSWHRSYKIDSKSALRDAIASCIERGYYPVPPSFWSPTLDYCVEYFINYFTNHSYNRVGYIDAINTSDDPFNVGHINLSTILAYQQVIAQYFTNDSIDSIFNSELYMQNLRSVMYPSINGKSTEFTFEYNGVSTEYDLISAGGTYHSLLSNDTAGNLNRQYAFASLMFVLRRSLRFGDYFSTARPNLLAVGQLSINVADGAVSPIDVTKNLLMQRYLNAANYIGSGFMKYMQSIFGVTPSDSGTYPRFIAHRKIPLANDVTTNTADNQGYQTTNLIGFTDSNGFDIFVDDFGVILNLVSYDVMPVYKSGIDNTYHFADRFDYFNPMLQGIGDQHIRVSEIIGNPEYRTLTFGYTMRNAEYKYKVSRAHGAFVNSLPGFMLPYPLSRYTEDFEDLHIDSDFIRDKPSYIDSIIPSQTGVSPAEYFHFVLSCTNEVNCARKIQTTPPVLF